MGWVSYVEDIMERFDQSSRLVDELFAEVVQEEDLSPREIKNKLINSRQEINKMVSILEDQILEFMADPDFDLFENWQATLDINTRLKIDKELLQDQVERQKIEYELRLLEIENQRADEVSGLRSKMKAERKEFERALKDANRK